MRLSRRSPVRYLTRFKQAVAKTARKNSPEWLTPREVAEYLQTGVDLIYDTCATGGLI